MDRYAVYIGPEGPISPEASGSPSLNEVPVQGLLRHQWRGGLRPQHPAFASQVDELVVCLLMAVVHIVSTNNLAFEGKRLSVKQIFQV